jgi:hypothetical protein
MLPNPRPAHRAVAAGVALLALCTPALVLLPDADAAVLCQRKKKLTIREAACKAKETLVQDLGQLGTGVQQLGSDVQQLGGALGAQGGRLDAQTARVDFVVGQLRLECPAAPQLVRSETTPSFYFENIECGGGCRAHDGDPAACAGAWSTSEDGATSCFVFDGLCLPCADCGERAGACINACRPPHDPGCPTDPTRTVFAGGPGSQACERFEDQASCVTAYHAGQNDLVASCYWTGTRCFGCGPRNENDGDCTNTCRTTTCVDPTRTNLQECDDLGSDEVICNGSFQLAEAGGAPESCRFDADADACVACGIVEELRGRCTNVCR